MEAIKIEVTGNIAKVTDKPNRITSGTVGMPVEFTFGGVWDGLEKVAVFQAGYVRRHMGLVDGATAVPMEVLAKANVRLNIGVYGVNADGSIAIPTIWVNLGKIREGAVPGCSAGSDIGLAKKYYNQGELAAENADASAQKAEAEAGVAENAAERAEKAANSVAGMKPQDLKVTATFDTPVEGPGGTGNIIMNGYADMYAYDIASAINGGATVVLVDNDDIVYKYNGYRLEPNYSRAFFRAEVPNSRGVTVYSVTINNDGTAGRTECAFDYVGTEDETSVKCVLDVSENLINPAEITDGGYFNVNTGEIISGDNYGYSGYVKVNAGTTYYIKNDGAWRIMFYNADKNFLSGISGHTEIPSFVTPDEAKYLRVSTWLGSIYDTTISQTSVDAYLQYHDPIITFLNPINADSVEWVRKSVWNGTYNDDSTAISTELFYMLAGSKITFSNAYKVRITVFDANKNYISNTGTFVYMDAYDIAHDCYVAISLDSSTKVPISAGNSSNVQFLGYEKIVQKTDEEIENDVIEKVKKNTYNSVYSNIEDVFTPKLSEFAGHAISTGAVEQFAFATDFHTIDRQDNWQENHRRILSNIQRIYNNSPANFIMFGGDWLSSGLNVSDLCTKLGFLKGNIQNMFRNGYTVVGNHDICYEGGKINEQAMSNALFGGAGCYYSFDGAVSKCYALDTGYDNDLKMTDYRWGQIDWFANRLIEDDHTNTLVFMHVYTRAETADAVNAESVHPVARAVVDLASAFNKRTSVTINGITYDFADCTGKVRCIITGHTHFDCDLVDNDVPIVCCDMALREVDGVPTFDLCSADYGTNTLYLTRVGRGSSRSIAMVD